MKTKQDPKNMKTKQDPYSKFLIKIKKVSPEAIMAVGKSKLKEAFNSNDWTSLGWIFWNLFIFTPNGKKRKEIGIIWNSLPKWAKKNCESI